MDSIPNTCHGAHVRNDDANPQASAPDVGNHVERIPGDEWPIAFHSHVETHTPSRLSHPANAVAPTNPRSISNKEWPKDGYGYEHIYAFRSARAVLYGCALTLDHTFGTFSVIASSLRVESLGQELTCTVRSPNLHAFSSASWWCKCPKKASRRDEQKMASTRTCSHNRRALKHRGPRSMDIELSYSRLRRQANVMEPHEGPELLRSNRIVMAQITLAQGRREATMHLNDSTVGIARVD